MGAFIWESIKQQLVHGAFEKAKKYLEGSQTMYGWNKPLTQSLINKHRLFTDLANSFYLHVVDCCGF